MFLSNFLQWIVSGVYGPLGEVVQQLVVAALREETGKLLYKLRMVERVAQELMQTVTPAIRIFALVEYCTCYIDTNIISIPMFLVIG